MRKRGKTWSRYFYPQGSHLLRLSECPREFQKAVRKIFQGLQIAKATAARQAAESLNRALEQGHKVLTKLLEFGMEAIGCGVRGEWIELDIKPVHSDIEVFTIRDMVHVFVTA